MDGHVPIHVLYGIVSILCATRARARSAQVALATPCKKGAVAGDQRLSASSAPVHVRCVHPGGALGHEGPHGP